MVCCLAFAPDLLSTRASNSKRVLLAYHISGLYPEQLSSIPATSCASSAGATSVEPHDYPFSSLILSYSVHFQTFLPFQHASHSIVESYPGPISFQCWIKQFRDAASAW